MSPLLFVGPLLVAHLVTPTREVRGHGVVVHATSAEIDVHARGMKLHAQGDGAWVGGVTRRIRISTPVQSIEIVDARTLTTHSPGARITYVDGHETSSCRFLSPTSPRVGTLVRTTNGKTTYAMVRLGANEQDPCAY